MKVYVVTSGDSLPVSVDGVFTDWNVAVKAIGAWHYGVDLDELRSSKVEVDGKTIWTTGEYGGPRITQIDLS